MAGIRHGAGALALAAGLLLPAGTRAASFGFADVRAKAAALAAAPYQPAPSRLPAFLRSLDYDQYRDIRFRPNRAIWKAEGLPFRLELFHPGFSFDRPVTIHLVDSQGVHRLAFSPDSFDYGHNHFPEPLPADLGYAGFRLHYPLNRPGVYDEVIAFLGASYFRAVARGLDYGLSARGIAVDTAEPGGEEFPAFTDFWIEKPKPDATSITVYALLDGPSLAGAYRFEIAPGEETRVDVRTALFLRRSVSRLGIAPLTSMFWHGEDSRRRFGDFRPEVHDSDGLLVAMHTGEWIWRPLVNPRKLRVTSFHDDRLRGFGLLQRDRDFADYQDLEAHYERRPSAWVTPESGFGPGTVQLVEIPSQREVDDNIVAFFVPDRPARPGSTFDLSYRIDWYGRSVKRPPGGRTVATRVGDVRPADAFEPKPLEAKFVLDFGGGGLDRLAASAPVDAKVSVGSGGTLLEKTVEKNEATGGWRAVFEVRAAKPDVPIELRCFLARGEDALTETWSYLWTP